MMLYKLTDEKDQTKNQTQWGKGVTHKTDGDGDLCGPGWLHAYTDPLLAVLLNPIHGGFDEQKMHLWEAKGEIEKRDFDLKVGCKKLTTTKRIDIPQITLIQRCRFAILVAKEVYTDKQFNKWADDWLSGKDRSEAAAWAAWAAAGAAAGAAAWAAWAARAAARAAAGAAAGAAAEAAAEAAAGAAAEAAARAKGKQQLDLAAIARKACKE